MDTKNKKKHSEVFFALFVGLTGVLVLIGAFTFTNIFHFISYLSSQILSVNPTIQSQVLNGTYQGNTALALQQLAIQSNDIFYLVAIVIIALIAVGIAIVFFYLCELMIGFAIDAYKEMKR